MKRRKFLENSALLSAMAVVPPVASSCTRSNEKTSVKKISSEELGMFSFVDVAPDGIPIKAALIGCGDRGTGAASQFLESGPNVSVVALADVFPDMNGNMPENTFQKNLTNNVAVCQLFLGFDAYKKVLGMSDVNLVLLCTPTHFRPEHFKAAVEAGKHVLWKNRVRLTL